MVKAKRIKRNETCIKTILSLSSDAILRIQLVNLHGQIVLNKRIRNNHRVKLTQPGSTSGLFLLTVQSNHFFGTSKIVLLDN